MQSWRMVRDLQLAFPVAYQAVLAVGRFPIKIEGLHVQILLLMMMLRVLVEICFGVLLLKFEYVVV